MITFAVGERLSDVECDEVIRDCMDPEDDDGFIPYARKYRFVLNQVPWMRPPPPINEECQNTCIRELRWHLVSFRKTVEIPICSARPLSPFC